MTLCVILLPITIMDKLPLMLDLLLIVSVYQLLLVQNIPSSQDDTLAERIVTYVFTITLVISLFAVFLLFFKFDSYAKDPIPKIYQLIY